MTRLLPDLARSEEIPAARKYALCRCSQSKNKPFCDGTHAKINFDGTEAGDHEPFDKAAQVIQGPALTLSDNEHLCVHARFCMRAGGIKSLVEQSDDQEAKDLAIEEACNCPSGRLVVTDNESGKAIEPEFDKSIVVIEYPPRGRARADLGARRRSLNQRTANRTKFVTGSLSADAEDRRTSRYVTAAILRDKLDNLQT